MDVNRLLLILHFLGLAMAFATGFANLTMTVLINRAEPVERPVLARFPPLMARFADVGLTLLWVTGLTMVYTKYGGFGVLPWPFHVKLTCVVILTVLLGYIHMLMARARKGDAAAAARIPVIGRLNVTLGVIIVVFAVLSFD